MRATNVVRPAKRKFLRIVPAKLRVNVLDGPASLTGKRCSISDSIDRPLIARWLMGMRASREWQRTNLAAQLRNTVHIEEIRGTERSANFSFPLSRCP